jgi:CubicO group peptidase (beta-lactamase class C family)
VKSSVCIALVAVLSASMPQPDSAGTIRRFDGKPIAVDHIDREARRLMREARVQSLAMAVVDESKVTFVRAWGARNVAAGLPLQTDTVMYGASLTKFAFAYMVMQLVDEGRIALDRPIAEYLPRPLPEYPFYAPLQGDERWRKLTPRILLSHRSGFANFAFLEPDEKLRINFDPGTRYAYSGEGITLLQFVLETGLGLNVGDEMQRRVFDTFGMTRTSMTWRRPRAAGSMDTTIEDFAKFLAGFMRGEGISRKSRTEIVEPQLAIRTARQFPTLRNEPSPAMKAIKLSAGLGVVIFEGPYGKAFFKGGHNDTTGNQMICLERHRRCVLFLSNDVRAESIYQRLTEATVGDPGMPWSWEGYRPYDLPALPAKEDVN